MTTVQVGYITLCWSLCDLHSLGPYSPRCVNHTETQAPPRDVTYTYCYITKKI